MLKPNFLLISLCIWNYLYLFKIYCVFKQTFVIRNYKVVLNFCNAIFFLNIVLWNRVIKVIMVHFENF